jgi:hypothetical protein
MKVFLLVLAFLAFCFGFLQFVTSKSEIHEVEAFVLILVAATLFAGATIIEAVERGHRKFDTMTQLLSKLRMELQPVDDAQFAEVTVLPPDRGPAYWVRIGNENTGPFTIKKIRELCKRGAIDSETPVSLEGSQEWMKTGDIILT